MRLSKDIKPSIGPVEVFFSKSLKRVSIHSHFFLARPCVKAPRTSQQHACVRLYLPTGLFQLNDDRSFVFVDIAVTRPNR